MMVVDKKYMGALRNYYRYGSERFTEELEQLLYDRLGREPSPFEYSDQDLFEQSRKIVEQYQDPEGRLRLVYGLDRIENQIGFLKQKHAYLERKIAYQLQAPEGRIEEFIIEYEYEDEISLLK